jgi:mono/diheme cytochrome c family protein
MACIKRSGLVVFAAMAVVLLPGTPGVSQEEKGGVDRNALTGPLEGSELFKNYCAACHGMEARGNGPSAPALKKPVPDLTQISQRNGGRFPREQVRNYISGESDILAHGTRAMPIWGPIFRQLDRDSELGEIRLHNVTVYVESLQKTKVESLLQK